MDFGHYTDQTARLAVALANAFVDLDGQAVEPRTADLNAVLPGFGVRGRVTRADLPGLRRLAEELREVFAARGAADAADRLNALLAVAPLAPRISRHDDSDPHVHYAAPGAALVDRLRADTAMSLAGILCDFGVERLGACAAEGCRRVFVDTSRNAQRRYCSDVHANRANVAAHRARTARGGASSPVTGSLTEGTTERRGDVDGPEIRVNSS